jgi:hypothetical protein
MPLAGLAFACLVAAAVLAIRSDGEGVNTPVEGDGPWTIGVEGEIGKIEDCLDDPSVSDGLVSADMPPSHASVRLASNATSEDVTRILRCIEERAPSASIVVSSVVD